MNIAVIGTGYVGLVTGACLAELEHKVICVDRQMSRVNLVKSGIAPFHEAGLEAVMRAATQAGRLSATSALHDAVKHADVIMIAVGTPLGGTEIDLSQVNAAAAAIGLAMREAQKYQVVVVKSTVVPGTTEGPVHDHISQALGRGLPAFGLCMNPEFLREGTAVEDFRQSDRIVLGCVDSRTEGVMRELYQGLTSPIFVTTPRNAEMIKYTANSLLATLVSFSNEIATLCENVPGLDVDLVMDGVHLDRRLTFRTGGACVPCEITSFLRAGNGFGGSCLPKDVNALRAYARRHSVTTPLLDSVMRVNDARPDQVVDLLTRVAGSLSGRRVAFLGLAFKEGTDDLRDSPALALVSRLQAEGVKIRAYDPIAGKAAGAQFAGAIEIVDSIEEAARDADVTIIATAWPEFRRLDWHAVGDVMAAPVIVDLRRVLRSIPLPASMAYYPIGTAPPSRNLSAAALPDHEPPLAVANRRPVPQRA